MIKHGMKDNGGPKSRTPLIQFMKTSLTWGLRVFLPPHIGLLAIDESVDSQLRRFETELSILLQHRPPRAPIAFPQLSSPELFDRIFPAVFDRPQEGVAP